MLLPPSSAGTVPSPSPDCATPRTPAPVGALPPSVLAADAAWLAGWSKQEVSGGQHGELVTPVAGVAGEAEVPGSSSLPCLGSQSLAPWPDPQQRASPALSPCLQHWLCGKERHRHVGGAPHPSTTPIPSLSLFPLLNPLRRSSWGGLSWSCTSQLVGMGSNC